METEAKIQALALVEILAQVLMGTGESEHGVTLNGKAFKRIPTKEGLARMGVFL